MSEIDARGLTVAFRNTQVLSKLDLSIADGEFVVLLGPSGCGKSTLLNAIAGLLDIDAGEIWIGGRNVTALEPKERGLAMVFQSYALYPNMDVRGNLAFALKVAGVPRQEREARVVRVAEMLALTPLLKRRPIQLSGGQRQRVAIGRALVRDVDVFLFDEPLSNLDAQLRAELRVEIKQLHKRLGATMVYVTHDQIEALTLADRIVVLKSGAIQQIGDPETIYGKPENLFVAGFLGSPPMNLVPGALVPNGNGIDLSLDGQTTALNGYPLRTRPGGECPVMVGVRPEQIVLGEAAAAADFRWDAPVELQELLGGETLLWSRLAGSRFAIKTAAKTRVRDGEAVRAGFAFSDLSLFDAATGERL